MNMKKIIIVIIALFSGSIYLQAQSGTDKIMVAVEQNNTTLKALKAHFDAEKQGTRTGIFLQNPEVEFNYLWGSPAAIGNRTDISVTQTFDFPSAYHFKNQIADYKNAQFDLEYQKEYRSLILKTRLLCADLTYLNALSRELTRRKQNAGVVAEAFRSKFDSGDINILDYNKAKVNLINAEKALESVAIEREAVLGNLTGLNGGIRPELEDTAYQNQTLPDNFETWYGEMETQSPVLQWLKQEIAISQKQEKLNAALSLPKLQAGYMSENVVGQQFQGVTAGISIPLWENSNKVKYAKARTVAVQGAEADAKLQFYNHLQGLFQKAVTLQKTLTDFRQKLNGVGNNALLQKALTHGEISLTEYMLEFSIYYESYRQLLEMERDFSKTVAELNQYK
mgnify:CR=1 FL=1